MIEFFENNMYYWSILLDNCVRFRHKYQMGNKTVDSELREGSVVIITGASSGLGKELALILCKRKVRLIITGRDSQRLNEVKALCEKEGNSQIVIFEGDLTKETVCKDLIALAQKAFNRLDCLILNAGVNAHFQFSQLSDTSVFESLMRTNLYANVYLMKSAMPLLKRTSGRVVVISSLSGKFGLPSRSAYCASKFALNGFFESLKTQEDFPVMMVYPTSLETPMRSNSLIKSQTQANQKRQSPKQCAQLIVKGLDEGREEVFMPWKGWLGVVLQPLFPRFMRWKVKQAARL